MTTIIIERGSRRDFIVRANPDPQDGTCCRSTFRDVERARHFAWQLRRSRGWTIVDQIDQARQARES